MRRIVWSDQALDDLDEIRRYIADFNPQAAIRFFIRLQAAGESLSEFPGRGRLQSSGLRELLAVKPYVIRYVVEPTEVLIITVRHSARRPQV